MCELVLDEIFYQGINYRFPLRNYRKSFLNMSSLAPFATVTFGPGEKTFWSMQKYAAIEIRNQIVSPT